MATGLDLVGGAGNDTLTGGVGDDTLIGLGGDDSLTGDAGNDSIAGGDGNDRIFPGLGQDTVDGGNGNDWIDLNAGGGSTSQSVHGGAGDDTIFSSNQNAIRIWGDDGNDTLTLFRGTIDGGAGNDTLTISDGTVTGGDGQDRFIIGGLYSFTPGVIQNPWAVTVTDFTAGSNGDQIDLSNVLALLKGYTGGDPFGRYMWVAQSGGTARLYIDRDMAGADYGSEVVASFQDTFINDLTSANFVGGFVPTKSTIVADSTLTGTAGDDTLGGGWGNDTITGGAGNDRITDMAGTNSLSGGAGDDYLVTNAGVLDGGDGNDTLRTQAGKALMNGGAGDDSILGYIGDDTLNGGDGNDTLNGGLLGSDLLDGGAGNDVLTVGDSQSTLHGGQGNDILTQERGGTSHFSRATLYGDDGDDILIGDGATLDGGAGNDRIEVVSGQVAGGSGADLFIIEGVAISPGLGRDLVYSIHTTTITDLNPAEGDKIDLKPVVYSLRGFEGGNPFGKYLWLQQDGADTLVMVDPDLNKLVGYDVEPGILLRLKNVTASTLTSSAFVQGYDLSILSQYQPQTVTGSDGNDNLVAGRGHDVLNGGNGTDLLTGGEGNDTLYGGNGIDAARFTGAPNLGTDVLISHGSTNGGPMIVTVLDSRVYGDGNDKLDSVEIGIFGNRVLPLIAPSKWALSQPYDHTQFDDSAYLALYPDVARAVAADQFSSGEAHYLAFGKNEGRYATAQIGGSLALFDANFYLLENPDVAVAVRDHVIANAWTHFVQFGEKEGRDPNTLFDTDWYLATNPDVAAAVGRGNIDALTHFALYGWKEGRDPSRWFDTSAYLAANPDVAAAGMNPLLHYLNYGYYEGRVLTYTADLI